MYIKYRPSKRPLLSLYSFCIFISLFLSVPVIFYFLHVSLLIIYYLYRTSGIGVTLCQTEGDNGHDGFYARKQLLLSARLSHRNSVRSAVCLSVCLSHGWIRQKR